MEGWKHGVDVAGAVAALTSVARILPDVLAAVASLLTIIWYTIRLIEWTRKRRVK